MSLLVHLVLAIIAALVTMRFGGGGGSGGSEGAVEFAVMTEADLAADDEPAAAASTPAAPEVTLPEAPSLDVSTDAALTGPADAPLGEGLELAGGSLSAGGAGLGDLGGGGGGASFFGLEAQGTRFAYVVDFSVSMNTNERITLLRRELSRSLNALPQTAEFIVVPYHTQAVPLDRPPQWREATDTNRKRAELQMDRSGLGGGTRPLGAFEIIFSLRPRPDAIYFMTDGQFQETDVPGAVAALNRRSRVPVHCVLFGDFSASEFQQDALVRDMRRIADESGGQFTQVSDR